VIGFVILSQVVSVAVSGGMFFAGHKMAQEEPYCHQEGPARVMGYLLGFFVVSLLGLNASLILAVH